MKESIKTIDAEFEELETEASHFQNPELLSKIEEDLVSEEGRVAQAFFKLVYRHAMLLQGGRRTKTLWWFLIFKPRATLWRLAWSIWWRIAVMATGVAFLTSLIRSMA